MRNYLLAIALPFFAACATAPAPATPVASEEVPANCYKEMRVGSSIPVLTCRETMSEADRQAMIAGVRGAIRPNPQAAPK